jgi:hypothetical protein
VNYLRPKIPGTPILTIDAFVEPLDCDKNRTSTVPFHEASR